VQCDSLECVLNLLVKYFHIRFHILQESCNKGHYRNG